MTASTASLRYDACHRPDTHYGIAVKVIGIVYDHAQAISDVERLNAINAGKGLLYWYRPTQFLSATANTV